MIPNRCSLEGRGKFGIHAEHAVHSMMRRSPTLFGREVLIAQHGHSVSDAASQAQSTTDEDKAKLLEIKRGLLAKGVPGWFGVGA